MTSDLQLEKNKPILIVDADEVILKFVEALEVYLNRTGFDLDLASFQLSGNIKHRETGLIAKPEEVKTLISDFFDHDIEKISPVENAAAALSDLGELYQIIVLSNVPERCRDRRQNHLREHGFNYPLIANSGGKGTQVRRMHDFVEAPSIFIDDLPPQHTAVAGKSPDTYRIHMIADNRLAKLIGKAPDAHHREDRWDNLKQHLTNFVA